MSTDMTPVERLRAAEMLLRERAEEFERAKKRQSIGAMMTANDALNEVGLHGTSVALAMAEVLATQVKRAELVTSWRQRDMFYGQEAEEKAHLALADALLGGGGA